MPESVSEPHESQRTTVVGKVLSPADRKSKTRHQIELLDGQLAKEFPELPADAVHREVARVSEGLLAEAHFTDHVAVLTGRFAAEHLRAIVVSQPEEAS